MGLLYSIVFQDWSPRPAYEALKELNVPGAPEGRPKGTGIFVWPTSGRISERFGVTTLDGCWHGGLDIATDKGTAVYAADSGVVTSAGSRGSYGNLVIVDHQNGFETFYAHLDRITVSVGESIAKGDILGTVGETGAATGPHLHLEIRERSVRKDPELYLP
jgi:murein DD-endopeptidase MepM/ murein hydrolase activator NlpD